MSILSRLKSTDLRGEEIPSVNPVVFGVVGLTQRAVDEQGVQRHHRGENEVVQHNAHQVQVLHLKFFDQRTTSTNTYCAHILRMDNCCLK